MKYSNYAVYDTTFNFLSSDGNGFWACLDFVELHIFSVLFNFYEYLILNLSFAEKILLYTLQSMMDRPKKMSEIPRRYVYGPEGVE